MIDPAQLQTVHNYAASRIGRNGKPVTVGYVYKLIKEKKLPTQTIDGMVFIDLSQLPSPAPASSRE